MKRVIALVLLLSGVMTLFAFNVSAENTYIRNIRTYSGYKSSASLTYSATACQFHYNSDTSLSGGIYSPVLITVRFTNNGSNDVKIANSYIDLTFTSTADVQGYDCYTSDLMVQVAGTAGQHTPRYNIIGGDGFSYNGHIVVPHNSSIYLVFEVDIAGSINTSTSQPEGPGLDAVFVSVADADVQTGDFVSGIIPRQLDSIESLINSIAGYVYTDNQNLVNLMQQVGSIKNLLTDIKNLIQFTGSYSQVNGGSSTKSVEVTFPNTSATVRITVTYLNSYYLNDDVEIAGSNTLIESGTRVTPAVMYISIYNTGRKVINTYSYWVVGGLGNYSKEITALYSDDFGTPYLGTNNVRMIIKHINGIGSGMISNVRDHYSVMYYNIYSNPNDSAPNATDLSLSLTYYREDFSTDYYPSNEYDILRDIYLGMQSSSSSDISTGSSTLNQTESQVHQQEQLYFQQNVQAILDTGLSNYRFNTEQSNGISAVSIDFTQLWNALGSWNSVYIFTLTLTIALTILRHAPNAISTARRRNYDHNDRSS